MRRDEWEACTEPQKMLAYLSVGCPGVRHRLATDRALRLFACACCRQPEVWDQLTDPRSRAAVETAERYALGLATEGELRDAWLQACSFEPTGDADRLYRYAALNPDSGFGWMTSLWAGRRLENLVAPARQAALLRCLVNPWAPAALGEACVSCLGKGLVGLVGNSWEMTPCKPCHGKGIRVPPPYLTPSVLATARTVRERRSGHQILWDELQEANCPATLPCPDCDKGWRPKTGTPNPGMMSRCPNCLGKGSLPHPLAHLGAAVHAGLGCHCLGLILGDA